MNTYTTKTQRHKNLVKNKKNKKTYFRKKPKLIDSGGNKFHHPQIHIWESMFNQKQKENN